MIPTSLTMSSSSSALYSWKRTLNKSPVCSMIPWPSKPLKNPYVMLLERNTVIPLNKSSPDYLVNTISELSTNSITSGSNSIDSQWIVDPGGNKSYEQNYLVEYPFEATSMSSNLVMNMFNDSFNRGMEEARKFLPQSSQLVIDVENYRVPQEEVVVKVENKGREKEELANGSRTMKNHHREETYLEEERSSKQVATYVEESELSEMFDKVLLCPEGSV
ncbi:hypothetical protein NMG60_11024222 [Bertholletia excelsa]